MMAEDATSNEPKPPQDSGMFPDAPISSSPAQTPEPQPDVPPEEENPQSEIPTVEIPPSKPELPEPPSEPVAEPVAEPAPETPQSEIPKTEIPPPTPETTEAPAEPPAGAAEKDDEEEKQFDPATDLPMYREGMDWFVLRVASNKENFVKETLLRKVQIETLEDRVGRIMVPTEKTKTLKGGKTRITETKLYPGYIFVEMRLEPDGRIPQDVFFLIKETTGVGDFVGTAGRPTPMGPDEVEKMLFDSRRPEETPSVKMEFAPGDYVIINEGPFESYEGTVDEVLPEKGLVRVLVTIFGRQAPIELEYWQIEKAD